MIEATLPARIDATSIGSAARPYTRLVNAALLEVFKYNPQPEKIITSRLFDVYTTPATASLLQVFQRENQVNFRNLSSAWAQVREGFKLFTSHSFEYGELPISSEAVKAAEEWIKNLEKVESSLLEIATVEATGMSNGGAVLVLTGRKTRKQFTLRFDVLGNFYMASGVSKNLKVQRFRKQDIEAESVLGWLKK